ncbi:MAG: pentapeptide repeat-containing protein, partial [Parvibaculaceae bacterium]
VDLSQALDLTQEQIIMACGNGQTKLPPGLAMPPHWPCAED